MMLRSAVTKAKSSNVRAILPGFFKGLWLSFANCNGTQTIVFTVGEKALEF